MLKKILFIVSILCLLFSFNNVNAENSTIYIGKQDDMEFYIIPESINIVRYTPPIYIISVDVVAERYYPDLNKKGYLLIEMTFDYDFLNDSIAYSIGEMKFTMDGEHYLDYSNHPFVNNHLNRTLPKIGILRILAEEVFNIAYNVNYYDVLNKTLKDYNRVL